MLCTADLLKTWDTCSSVKIRGRSLVMYNHCHPILFCKKIKKLACFAGGDSPQIIITLWTTSQALKNGYFHTAYFKSEGSEGHSPKLTQLEKGGVCRGLTAEPIGLAIMLSEGHTH